MRKPLIRNSVACGASLIALVGCSIGGKYGYAPAAAPIPASIASEPDLAFAEHVGFFLRRELSGCGNGDLKLERISAFDSVQYKVRGLRGCVIGGGREWEFVQVSFTRTGSSPSKVFVVADAWIAPGFSYPSDSQFTQSMDRKFPVQLQDFCQKLADDFGTYSYEGRADD